MNINKHNMQLVKYFFLCSCSTQPITVPIIVTLLTSTGATDQLRNEVGQQIAAHHEERGVDISILNVIRFGEYVLSILYI